MTTDDSDPVSVGIREWQKCKQAAEEALACAKKAEQEVAYYRGQCELLQQQHKADLEKTRLLQQHCDEMDLMIDTLGAGVLSIIEKRKSGFFRKPGSIENGKERTQAAQPVDLDENLRDLARSMVRGNGQQQPAKQTQ